MTKQVRIENACTNQSQKVRIIVQDCGWNSAENKPDNNWVDTNEIPLDYPTAMYSGCLTNTRRFIVVERST